MQIKNFIEKGFAFIDSDVYINDKNITSLYDLKKIFSQELETDQDCHFRKRGYLKLIWNRQKKQLSII